VNQLRISFSFADVSGFIFNRHANVLEFRVIANPEYPKTTADSTCFLPFFLSAPSSYETANIHLLLFYSTNQPSVRSPFGQPFRKPLKIGRVGKSKQLTLAPKKR
jgi:hypothetical protein